jgi:hypothetical protein
MALFDDLGDGHSDMDEADDNGDDVFQYDEDLSPEQLAEKQAGQELTESEAERPVQHGAPAAPDSSASSGSSASSVSVDGPAITALSEDPAYRAIFDEMVQELIQALEAEKLSSGDPAARQKTLQLQSDRLLHAAQQMGFEPWVNLMEGFAFDLPGLDSDPAIDTALDKLLSQVKALHEGEAAPAAPEVVEKPATPAAIKPARPKQDPAAPRTHKATLDDLFHFFPK